MVLEIRTYVHVYQFQVVLGLMMTNVDWTCVQTVFEYFLAILT